jgi:hypothetical protein
MKRFTEKEDSFIVESYQHLSLAEIGKELKRDESSIRSRLKSLSGVGRIDITKRFIWNQKENQFILDNYYKPVHGLSKHVNLTPRNLKKRLNYLFKIDDNPKYKAFSKPEVDFIKENYKKMSIFEMSKKMRRNENSIYGKMALLRQKNEIKLKRNKEMINKNQMKYIIENYGKETPTQIANKLGIHMMKVAVTLTSLRKKGIITETMRYKYNTEKICEHYNQNKDDKSIRQLSKELDVPTNSFKYHIKKGDKNEKNI